MQPFHDRTRLARTTAGIAFSAATLLASFAPLTLSATPAAAASFDCHASGLSANEKTICDNLQLNDDDVKMATMYTMLKGLFAMGVSGDMADEQKAWLAKREACGTDVSCISEAYQERIDALQKLYDGIDKPI
ncbi:lysozyme inhibitor LprI family protein [Martelella alba]|uniref:lysozyme inhibitor LprI family protein n=1 Tax=Martelella alba TaxID=2590451 RepID=UPI001F19499F|nr:hypothetical protein [Martelella alba]